MTDYHYLDTCAVVSWCYANTSLANSLDSACSAALNSLLATPTSKVAISELTLIEWHGSLARLWRDTAARQIGEEWVRSSMAKLMKEIASEALKVIAVPPKAAEHAMLLVTVATRDHNLSFKAWDATHIITAAAWARSVGEKVTFVTSDKAFEKFLDKYGYFRNLVNLNLITA